MKPKFLDGKWYVEVFTKDFGNVLLLNNSEDMVIPVVFNTEKEVNDFIKENI